jgi:hypothetical protein
MEGGYMSSDKVSGVDFEPEIAIELIPILIPGCKVASSDDGRTIYMQLTNQPLELHVYGRLLLINGKCRNKGIKLVVQCSKTIAQELASHDIDRLIFVEPAVEPA